MTAREKAKKNIHRAFLLWDKEYRATPKNFLLRYAPGRRAAKIRALYFVSLLDRVSGRKGKGAK